MPPGPIPPERLGRGQRKGGPPRGSAACATDVPTTDEKPAGGRRSFRLGISRCRGYDEVFAWLEKGYVQHSNTLIALKAYPLYDPLRGNLRFQDLLRRVGLAEQTP